MKNITPDTTPSDVDKSKFYPAAPCFVMMQMQYTVGNKLTFMAVGRFDGSRFSMLMHPAGALQGGDYVMIGWMKLDENPPLDIEFKLQPAIACPTHQKSIEPNSAALPEWKNLIKLDS